jgi:hypothetical protein
VEGFQSRNLTYRPRHFTSEDESDIRHNLLQQIGRDVIDVVKTDSHIRRETKGEALPNHIVLLAAWRALSNKETKQHQQDLAQLRECHDEIRRLKNQVGTLQDAGVLMDFVVAGLRARLAEVEDEMGKIKE